MNKSQFIKQYNGRKFVKTWYGINTIEDVEKMRENFLQIARNNNTKLIEEENFFRFENFSEIFLKPKVKKQSKGVVNFRSTDYTFTEDGTTEKSYGTTPKAEFFSENGFRFYTEENNDSIWVQYILVEEN